MYAGRPAAYLPGMGLVRPTLLAVTATLLTATTLSVAPASAQTDTQQGARRDGHHFPVSVNTTVPAGGGSMITTPALGRDVDTLKVTVKPQGDATAEEKAVYDQFLNTIGNLSKGKRLLVCLMVYQAVSTPQDTYTDEMEISAFHVTLAGAVLISCLHMAGLLQSDTPARGLAARNRAVPPAVLAGRGCGQARPSLPATLEKTDDGYTLDAAGTTKKAGRQKYRVGCRVKGNTFIYKIRAAEKGVPVRRVLGRKVRVGIQSPPDASTSVPVKVTFATP